MTKPPRVFEHLGPHARQPPVAACCRLTERVWLTYNDLAESNRLRDPHSREFMILRMLYIAEITSSAVRLNASGDSPTRRGAVMKTDDTSSVDLGQSDASRHLGVV